MTGTQQRPAHLGGWTPGQLCFGFFALFCLLLILRNPDTAIEYMTSGLRLCARTVIPSLFPFLVLSELIVSGASAESFCARCRVCSPGCSVCRRTAAVPCCSECSAAFRSGRGRRWGLTTAER